MNIQDWLGKDNELGIQIWKDKYQFENETFEEWLERVSAGNKEIKELIKQKKFLFGGRILANRGLDMLGRKVTYSNCYVLPQVPDSIEGIYETARDLARTFSYGGGVGIDISNLRPKGSPVNNAAKTTTGAVSFMETFSNVSSVIGQEGRRGALMISMDCNHQDIEDFIDAKKNTDKLEGCNISVRVNDEFMEKVLDKETLPIIYSSAPYLGVNEPIKLVHSLSLYTFTVSLS
jgi:ribonucleoside-diphosphate reductase alpha chain